MIGILLGISLLLSIQGVQNGDGTASERRSPTGLTLSTSRDVYQLHEPIELVFELSNESGTPIRGHFDLRPGDQLRVSYRREGQPFIPYAPEWLVNSNRGCSEAVETVIAPNSALTKSHRLFFNSTFKKIVLSEPGEYEFKASFFPLVDGSEFRLSSNTIRIRVTEPSSKREIAAAAALQDEQLARFLEGDYSSYAVKQEGSPAAAGAEKAAAFLQQYPDSGVAPFVRERLEALVYPPKPVEPVNRIRGTAFDSLQTKQPPE